MLAVGIAPNINVTPQPELMGYKGPKASEIDVQSELFADMHFGECCVWMYDLFDEPFAVVLADPKSRTGQSDRKELVTSYASSIQSLDAATLILLYQNYRQRRTFMECS